MPQVFSKNDLVHFLLNYLGIYFEETSRHLVHGLELSSEPRPIEIIRFRIEARSIGTA
jgi:hypothetical protein